MRSPIREGHADVLAYAQYPERRKSIWRTEVRVECRIVDLGIGSKGQTAIRADCRKNVKQEVVAGIYRAIPRVIPVHRNARRLVVDRRSRKKRVISARTVIDANRRAPSSPRVRRTDDVHIHIVVRAAVGRVGRIVGSNDVHIARMEWIWQYPRLSGPLCPGLILVQHPRTRSSIERDVGVAPRERSSLRKSGPTICRSQDKNLSGRSVGIKVTKNWLRMVRDIDIAIRSHCIVTRPGKSLSRY